MIIKTPSRLHMCLIDMSGEYGRTDGGIGLTINQPNLILKGIESNSNKITVDFKNDVGIDAKPECQSKVIETAEKIRKFYDIETGFDFTQYDGFGDVMSAALLDFDYKELDDVVDYALDIQEEVSEKANNSLEGLTFCVTGKVHIYKNRDELKADIENSGGKVVSSMSSKVNYLVNNDITSTSSKNLAAKQAGIPIITEEELQAMF